VSMSLKNKSLLAAGLIAACATATAGDLDKRWYLSGGMSYTVGDSDRELFGPNVDVDNGVGGFAGVGKAINDWLNLELNLKGHQFDMDNAGAWNQYGATIDGLVFFNRNPAFAPFAVLGAGALRNDISHVSKSTSPIVEAGLGFMHDIDDDGAKLRLEARHRWDFADIKVPHGNKNFDDWVVMAGVSIPIGARPQAAAEPRPVPEVAAPRPMPTPTPSPVTETVVLKGVNFCFNCDTLSNEAKAILDGDAMALIQSHPNATFEIAGHTDAKGTDSYNLDLSRRRAGNVAAYLVSKGVAANRMSSHGYGESQPVADNGTETGRAANRRVELRITQ